MTAVIAKVVEHDTFARGRRLARIQAARQTPHNAAGARQKLFPLCEVTLIAVFMGNRPTPSVAS